jgi:hypothetical protein
VGGETYFQKAHEIGQF